MRAAQSSARRLAGHGRAVPGALQTPRQRPAVRPAQGVVCAAGCGAPLQGGQQNRPPAGRPARAVGGCEEGRAEGGCRGRNSRPALSLYVAGAPSRALPALAHDSLQVRASIKAVQEAECTRVKADIERFAAAVSQYMGSIFSKRSFFAWDTGVEAATADVLKVRCAPAWGHVGVSCSADEQPRCACARSASLAPATEPMQTAQDLEAMQAEHARLHSLGKLFDCSDMLDEPATSIKSTDHELAALRSLWQLARLAEKKLADWNQTVSCVPPAGKGSTALSASDTLEPAVLPARSSLPPWMCRRWRRVPSR